MCSGVAIIANTKYAYMQFFNMLNTLLVIISLRKQSLKAIRVLRYNKNISVDLQYRPTLYVGYRVRVKSLVCTRIYRWPLNEATTK